MKIDKEYLKQIKRIGFTVVWIDNKPIIKKNPKSKSGGLNANNFRKYTNQIIETLDIKTKQDCKEIRKELDKIEL